MISSVHRNSQSWSELPWKKFQRHLAGLQLRVFKATREGDERGVKSLQKLLIQSNSARHLAIELIRLDSYKYGRIITIQERYILERKVREGAANWRPRRKKSFNVRNAKTNKRSLDLDKIADLVWECLVGFAIQPTQRNYNFSVLPVKKTNEVDSAHSRWFKQYFSRLVSEGYRKILVINFETARLQIKPKAFMPIITLPRKIKMGVFRFLQMGQKPSLKLSNFSFRKDLSESLSGLLWSQMNTITPVIGTNSRLLVFLRANQSDAKCMSQIHQFLTSHGVSVTKKKTFISSPKEGIEYCRWHFRQRKDGAIYSQPSKSSYQMFCKQVKNILTNPNISINRKSERISRVVYEWRKQNKYCRLKGTFSLFKLKNQTWKRFNTKRRTSLMTKFLVEQAFPIL